MAEKIEIACPNCLRPLRVRVEYFGRQIQCKRCEHVFTAQAPPAEPRVVPWPAIAPSQEEFQDALRKIEELEAVGAERARRIEALSARIESLLKERDELAAALGSARLARSEDPDIGEDSACRIRVDALKAELAETRAEADRIRSTLDEIGVRFSG